jgi:hypothetical protein
MLTDGPRRPEGVIGPQSGFTLELGEPGMRLEVGAVDQYFAALDGNERATAASRLAALAAGVTDSGSEEDWTAGGGLADGALADVRHRQT